jgi:hypothetical protein
VGNFQVACNGDYLTQHRIQRVVWISVKQDVPKTLYQSLGIRYEDIRIDRGNSLDAIRKFSNLARYLQNTDQLLIACKDGCGGSMLMAACVLAVKFGVSPLATLKDIVCRKRANINHWDIRAFERLEQEHSCSKEEVKADEAEENLSTDEEVKEDLRENVGGVPANVVDTEQTYSPCVVPVRVEELQTLAMVDSGSALTIISMGALRKIRGETLQLNTDTQLRMRMMNGSVDKTHGTVSLGITVGEREFMVCAHVVDQPPTELVLGMDWLRTNGIKADFGEQHPSLEVGNRTIQMYPMYGDRCLGMVQIATTTSIPANMHRFVSCDLEHEVTLPGGLCMIAPIASKSTRGILVPYSLVDISGGEICVNTANMNTDLWTIKERESLGKLYFLDELECQLSGTEQERLTCSAKVLGTVLKGSEDEKVKRIMSELKMGESVLSKEEENMFSNLVRRYHDVFSEGTHDIGRTNVVEYQIELYDQRPIKQKPYRLTKSAHEEIGQQLADMQNWGIIKPSTSPWASPVVLVKKKDGTMRFCIDFRKVNQITIPDCYPIPRIDEALEALGGAKYFSTMDLAAGYWQVALEEGSKEVTAFTTREGLFQFEVLPFGLANAPGKFQRLMDAVLRGLKWDICLVYLDDIVVFAQDKLEMLARLEKVWCRLREAGLKMKPKKCYFFREEVAYLGHMVSAQGIRMDPAKIVKVKEWPVPRTKREVQEFMGLCNYYRKFVKGYANIAHPIYELVKKECEIVFTPERMEAFTNLKEALCSGPVLEYPVFDGRRFIVTTDASGKGLGAVLEQEFERKEKPIMYASRNLKDHETRYSSLEREALGVMFALQEFKAYIHGKEIVVRTDHAPLREALLKLNHTNNRLQKWATEIMGQNLTIEYKPGRENAVADGLSRKPLTEKEKVKLEQDKEQVVGNLITTYMHPIRLIMEKQKDCKHCKKLCKRVNKKGSKYSLRNDKLWHQGRDGKVRLVVPEECRHDLIEEVHGSIWGGHRGTAKVYWEFKKWGLFWPGMRKDISNWIKGCTTCIHYDNPKPHYQAPLKPIVTSRPFELVCMDVVGPMGDATKRGNKYILTIIDHFSKYAHFVALKGLTSEETADAFVTQVLCKHGYVERILTDRGTNFCSRLMKGILERCNVGKARTTSYYPQCNGVCERVNGTLKTMLAKLASSDNSDWDLVLPFVEFCYNNTMHETHGLTPNYVIFGREAKMPWEEENVMERTEDTHEYVTIMRDRVYAARELVKERANRARRKMKKQVDKRVRQLEVTEGDEVMIKKHTVARGEISKLSRKWVGPFKVSQVMADGQIEIEYSDGKRGRVNVVNLKKAPPARECKAVTKMFEKIDIETFKDGVENVPEEGQTNKTERVKGEIRLNQSEENGEGMDITTDDEESSEEEIPISETTSDDDDEVLEDDDINLEDEGIEEHEVVGDNEDEVNVEGEVENVVENVVENEMQNENVEELGAGGGEVITRSGRISRPVVRLGFD